VHVFLHVVTIGTSLLRNAFSNCNRLGSLSSYCELFGRWMSAGVDSSDDLEAGRNAVPSSSVFRAILDSLASDPRRLSAELNAFFSYLDSLIEPSLNYIVLLSSDTGTGWLCTRVLEEFMKPMDRIPSVYTRGEHYVKSVEATRVPLLGRDFSKGSINLVAEVKKTIAKYKNVVDEVLFNPTGGYKPETAYLLLTASLIGASRVYYIHETMGETVEIPVIPVEIKEPFKTILEKAKKGELTPLDYQVLRKHRVIRPGEKEPAWLQQIAKIILN